MRRYDELSQSGNAAIVEGHLGQGIDVVADQYAAELRLETHAVTHEAPTQEAAVHRVTKYQAAMITQYLDWSANLRWRGNRAKRSR